MNTKRRYIYLKICTLVMFVWLTACNRDPHEEERGMAVTIDNTQCPDVPIGAIKLYIYGTGGNLYATYNVGAHRIQLGYVRTRRGYNCSGGVCRLVPSYQGITLSYNYNF